MIKYYCDKCGKEMSEKEICTPRHVKDSESENGWRDIMLCLDDYKRYNEFLNLLNDKKDQALKGWWENGNNSEYASIL